MKDDARIHGGVEMVEVMDMVMVKMVDEVVVIM